MRQPCRRVSIACRASRTVVGPVCGWACALGAVVWGLGLCAVSLGSAGGGGGVSVGDSVSGASLRQEEAGGSDHSVGAWGCGWGGPLAALGSCSWFAAGAVGQACVAQCHCPQRLQGPGGGPNMSHTCGTAAIHSP